MITKFIDFKILFLSLVVGLFFVYVNQPPPTIIYVYPTPDNVDKIQYKDTIGNCYEFKHKEVKCPANKKDIHIIPIQES